jgi:hypothetical protein
MPTDTLESQQGSKPKLTERALINLLHEQLIKKYPIPQSDEKRLRDVLQQETSVFSVFVPIMNVAEGNCVLPIFEDGLHDHSYLLHFKRHATFFNKRNITYYLASDSRMMTDKQWENLTSICKNLKISLFDLKDIITEHPLNILKQFKEKSYSPNAEYIDYTKVALMNLAGQKPYKNILIIDPDIIFSEDTGLTINESNSIAFTYTKRHSTTGSGFFIENSMIYVDSNRPVYAYQGTDLDLVEKILSDIKTLLKLKFDPQNYYKHACYVFTLSTHDPVLLQNNKNLLSIIDHPLRTTYTRSDKRTNAVNEVVKHGDHMLHGMYSSINIQTWNGDRKTQFLDFSSAISQSQVPFDDELSSTPSLSQLMESLDLIPESVEQLEDNYHRVLKDIITIDKLKEVLKKDKEKLVCERCNYTNTRKLLRLPMVRRMIASLGYSYYDECNGYFMLREFTGDSSFNASDRIWNEAVIHIIFKNVKDIVSFNRNYMLPKNLFDVLEKELIENVEELLILYKSCALYITDTFMEKNFDYTLGLFAGHEDKLELFRYTSLHGRIKEELDKITNQQESPRLTFAAVPLFFKNQGAESEEASFNNSPKARKLGEKSKGLTL